jgi:hypothetical protein
VLVRFDDAFLPFFEPERDEPRLARIALTQPLELLTVAVDRRRVIEREYAPCAPLREIGGGAGVAVVAVRVGLALHAVLDAHDVVLAAVVERMLLGGRDHVVGRSDGERWVGERAVAKRAKGSDIGHAGV